MKKTIKSMLAFAVTALAFTACSDVPAPYAMPQEQKPEPIVYTGDGSKQNPYTATDAINYAKSLNQEESPNEVYIKGKVVGISEAFSTKYGNGTFTISDDGSITNVFTAYRVLYLGNKKFASGDTQIQIGDEVIVCGKVVNYRGNTPETVQGSGYLYSLNGKTLDSGDETAATVKGTGTQDDPYNVAGVLKYIGTLGADVESPADVFIKGKVKDITDQFSTQYGSGTFTIVDEGFTQTFTIYRALYLGNKKYTSGDLLKEGDEVIICGKVVNYRGNTPETAQGKAYLFSLNGKTEDTGTEVKPGSPTGTGTLTDPFNVAAAVKKCQETGETATTDIFYVKGIVSADYTVDSYKNATFDMIDAEGATEKFTAYRVKGADGKDLKVGYKIAKGATVIVSGKLVNYKGNTPETAQNTGTLVSVNGNAPEFDDGTTPEQGGGSGETASSLTNGDFEQWANGLPTGWKSASTASSATLSQSTDAHGGSYSCCVAGDASQNKRLASQEITLAAGTYEFAFYAKATTADKAQVRPGQVPVADGKVGSYAYGEYATISDTAWTKVTHEFTLSAETTVCLVVMNPKASSYSSGKDVLIDDATLTKK